MTDYSNEPPGAGDMQPPLPDEAYADEMRGGQFEPDPYPEDVEPPVSADDSDEPWPGAYEEAQPKRQEEPYGQASSMQVVTPERHIGEGPQPLVREIPDGAPYPVEALGPLRGAVEDVQRMVQAPIAIPAASALSIASLAVQGFADVEALRGTRPLSLYMLTIARSGERKSSCDAPLMASLREYESAKEEIRREDLVQWRNAHALWKGERDRILVEAKKGKGEKRTSSQADLDALKEPMAPPSADRTVTEPTFEGLTRLFAEGQPSLGIFSDEGGQFLGGYAMSSDNRQKTLAALNDLWQGNPIRRTRGGDGQTTLYGRRLAVHLMVQPGVAQAFMSDPQAVDTGFLPRFLICEPPSTIGTRLYNGEWQDSSNLDAFSARLRDILETPLPADEETRVLRPRVLPLEQQARSLLIKFHDAIEVAQKMAAVLPM